MSSEMNLFKQISAKTPLSELAFHLDLELRNGFSPSCANALLMLARSAKNKTGPCPGFPDLAFAYNVRNISKTKTAFLMRALFDNEDLLDEDLPCYTECDVMLCKGGDT